MEPLFFDDWIVRMNQTSTLTELAQIKQELFSKISDDFPLKEEMDVFHLYHILSQIHDQLTKKAVSFAEKQTKEEKIGLPPERYAWLTMGSGGRKEQTNRADQDNGLIYCIGKNQNQEQVERFVQRFAELAVNNLMELGYPLCQGNVMATNPRWQKTFNGWKETITSFLDQDSMNDIRYIFIAADFRVVYGDQELGDQLREWMLTFIQNNSRLLKRIANHVLSYEIPLGLFSQFYTERWGPYAGQFDLKYGAYIPWLNIIHWFSFFAGIKETTIIDRLIILRDKGIISRKEFQIAIHSFTVLLRLRFNSPFHHIDPKQLTSSERVELKKTLRGIKKLRRRIRILSYGT
ncbi:DUF294 nucleotidyltransferase-like domain-containing protein [Tepidibacillus fermentans]|uniref:CBS domain-containing protein n=1 Tax=Tepidibacillus fermentans TaxID=1281767 RepID=A0A4R3KJ58_9BACI|nr:DUF294 nucleotidyltransferase-like domain-containing protein [Tepidibacillus fermentans]TCS83706.1 CBS domain-containing protein [Tepidibacillus fermentans]